MAVQRQDHVVAGSAGAPIHIERHADPEREAHGCVIVCHGFKGFKRWGFFPHLAERVAATGRVALLFDFSHNGVGDGGEEFDRLDLFARNTVSREVVDLQRVLRWVTEQGPDAGSSAVRALGLVGHSRGAAPALVVAAEDQRIRAVVLWSPVGRLLRYSPGQLRRWEEDGSMEFTNARTGQRMAMDYEFVVDVREHAARLEPAAAVRRVQAPLLVLHGGQDIAVEPSESEVLREGPGPRERVVVPAGTHTFGAVHPFAGTTPALEQAVGHTLAWFDAHLGSQLNRT